MLNDWEERVRMRPVKSEVTGTGSTGTGFGNWQAGGQERAVELHV